MLWNVHLRSNKTDTDKIKINAASLKQIYIFLCSFYFINFRVVLLFYGSKRFRWVTPDILVEMNYYFYI